jgi:Nif-specific regulatory protein
MGHYENLSPESLSSLVDASRAINAHQSLEETLMAIARSAAAVMKTEASSVIMLDKARGKQVFRAAVGVHAEQLIGVEYDAGIGISGKAMTQGAPVVVEDVSKDKSFYKEIDAMISFHTRRMIAAPLINQGQTLGVVEVINPVESASSSARFTAQDVQLAQMFANMAAIAAANAQLYDRLSRENQGFRQSMQEQNGAWHMGSGRDKVQPGQDMIGTAPAMAAVKEMITRVANSSTTVLLLGETGTGKELAARKIHSLSSRRGHPFIAINCAALPETLLESELFGHEAGAFTGAKGRKLGRFELAEGGTIFLDEIGEVTLSTQVKLLRVLQEREIVRVGGTQTVSCDVRIIAATNRDLAADMRQKRFRDDLYYRLNVFPIGIPTLRDRREDIPLLANFFVAKLAAEIKMLAPVISTEAMAALVRYDFPGNIRELQNILERACLLCRRADAKVDEISLPHLPHELAQGEAGPPRNAPDEEPSKHPGRRMGALASSEKAMVLNALRQCDWNQSKAAKMLGISRDNIRYRIRKYRIEQP